MHISCNLVTASFAMKHTHTHTIASQSFGSLIHSMPTPSRALFPFSWWPVRHETCDRLHKRLWCVCVFFSVQQIVIKFCINTSFFVLLFCGFRCFDCRRCCHRRRWWLCALIYVYTNLSKSILLTYERSQSSWINVFVFFFLSIFRFFSAKPTVQFK